MNILVVGLGSMGKRRIRLLQQMHPEYRICGVDGRRDRCNEAQHVFGISCFGSIEEAKKSNVIDCAFICTSPLSHSLIIEECLNNKWHVFTELNLVADKYEENIDLARKNGCVLFLSSTFLYREEIQYIKEKVQVTNRWNYVYHIGQYLPDWHPWENYKDFFIGDKRTNGCREILAIELPWLIQTFGSIKNYSVISDKITDLNINFNDNYMIQFSHENGNKGVLVVDVVSPYAIRDLKVYGENRYIQWNGTPESLMQFDLESKEIKQVKLAERGEHQIGYSNFIVENAYRNEIDEFFNVVYKHKAQIYGFKEDLEVLQLIDNLEK